MRSVSEQLLRLQRIEPFLRCPQCGGKLIRQGDEAYKSESCGAQYAIDHGVPILLPPSLVAQGLGKPLPPDQHASTHPYSPSSAALIAQFEAGLVLDLGAGGKHIERANVVQVDVFRFPMVDVVASADALPFRADTFDAVISQAVFEHLQYPEAAAAEIWRILKPDGVAKIDTAFLQPEHAYPHHYFNATEAGLRHWFRDFELQWSGVEDYQHPKWALVWFLSVYFAGLYDKDRLVLEGLTLGECVAVLSRASKGESLHTDAPILQAMDGLIPDVVRTLAAGVSVQAIKKAAVPTVSRQLHCPSNSQLELERRLQAQTELLLASQEHKRVAAEIDVIASDRTRFLLHQHSLSPLFSSRLIRPAVFLLAYKIGERFLPKDWWERLQKAYLRRTMPRRSHTSISESTSQAIAFLGNPETPADLLNQFFSLVHQTHGNWVYLIPTSSNHSPVMKHLMLILQEQDARVRVLPEDRIKTRLLSMAWVRLPSCAILAFDGVMELRTLLQRYPEVRHITSDVEMWTDSGQRVMRCWGAEFESSSSAPFLTLVNSTPHPTSPHDTDTSFPLKTHAYIPKVLYRLVPFAES